MSIETVQPNEIKRRRSLNGLGGEIQEAEIPNDTVHGFFDKVDETGALLGEINYRGFYFYNSHDSLPVKNPVLYCPVNTISPGDEIRFGWDPAGVNKVMQTIPNEFTMPMDVNWNSGNSRTTGSLLGVDIPPKGIVGAWIERTVNFNAQSFQNDHYQLSLDYDRTDRIIPEGWGMAVMGNMGCGSIFHKILERVELRAPNAILSTGGNSYKTDGSCWLNHIEPLNDVWNMAFGETELKSASLTNQYLNYFGNGKQFYSFNVFNVHILIVSTGIKFSAGSEQYTFIVNDLKNASKDPRIDWILVVQQAPFWAAKDKAARVWPISSFRDLYSPIYEQNHVHLVLQGGPYNYQRLGIVNPVGAGSVVVEAGEYHPRITYGASRSFSYDKHGHPIMLIISHEIIEAMTDPDPLGKYGKRSWKWYNNPPQNTRWEIADFCSTGFSYSDSTAFSDGSKPYSNGLFLEPYWSNSDDGCVLPGNYEPDRGSSNKITNNDGGNVFKTPAVFFILWGKYWSTATAGITADLLERYCKNEMLGTNNVYFSKLSQYGGCGTPTFGAMVINDTTPLPSGKTITDSQITNVLKQTFQLGLLGVPEDDNEDIYLVIIPPDKVLGDEYGEGFWGYHNVFKPTITISKTIIPESNIEDQDPDYSFDQKGFARGFLSIIVGNTGGRDITEELDKVTEDPMPEYIKKVEWDKHGYLWLEWTNQGRKLSGRLYTKEDNSIDNFTISNLSAFSNVPPPPPGGGGGGGGGGTGGPPPVPQPIPLDKNGLRWMVATGNQSVHGQSRKQTGDFRWSKNYDNVSDYGFEATGIFSFSGVKSDGHWALKHWGGNHTSPCPHKEGGECCCWYDTGIRSNGDVQLEIERPHPHNEEFKATVLKTNIGKAMNGNTIGLKWLIYPIKVGGNADDGSGIKLKMWCDIDPLDSSGNPKNNWELCYDIIDKGQILGDYVGPSTQEIESRNSDTDSTTTWKGGIHVRLCRAGDTNPDIIPPPVTPPPTGGGSGTPTATWAAVGDWDCNSDTDKTISLMKSWNPGLIVGLGDYSYQNTKTCWINRIEAANIDELIEITLGNHETAEGTPSGLKDEYKTYFGYNAYWHAHTFQNIRFICMCSELDFSSGSAQYNFVTEELQAAKNNAAIKWIIVYCHSPLYPPSGSHHGATEWSPTLRATYHTMFEQCNVDLVLYGHNHNYDRTFPLQYNSSNQAAPIVASTATSGYVNMQGKPVMATIGTGGRGHYTIGSPSPWIVKRSDTWFGALRCDISNNGNTLTFKAIKNDGTVFDEWTHTKSTGGGGGTPNLPATMDQFGIKMLNGTKVGGRTWFNNWNNGHARTVGADNGTSGQNRDPDDPFSDLHAQDETPQNRMEIDGAGIGTFRGSTPRLYVNDQAHVLKWRYVEMTAYYLSVQEEPGGTIRNQLRLAGPTEHQLEWSCSSSGHGYSFEIKRDGTHQLKCENVHPAYKDNVKANKTGAPQNVWIGMKLVIKQDGQGNMLIQGWEDETDGLNGGNWIKTVEKIDTGSSWLMTDSTDIGVYNGGSSGSGDCTKLTPKDRMIDVPASSCYFRTDNYVIKVKKASIREINPV